MITLGLVLCEEWAVTLSTRLCAAQALATAACFQHSSLE
jgi:hypothetical protein